MLCTADVFRRLQCVVYNRYVQKAAICCVQQIVFRRLQYVLYSRCVQKAVICCVQQMCS